MYIPTEVFIIGVGALILFGVFVGSFFLSPPSTDNRIEGVDYAPVDFTDVVAPKFFDDDYKGPCFDKNDDSYTLWYRKDPLSLEGTDYTDFLVTKALPQRGFYWINPAGIKAWRVLKRDEEPTRVSLAALERDYRPESSYGHDKYAMPQK